MTEPVYRWECTICGASGVVDASEQARLMINRHVAAAHPDAPPAQDSSEPGSKRAI